MSMILSCIGHLKLGEDSNWEMDALFTYFLVPAYYSRSRSSSRPRRFEVSALQADNPNERTGKATGLKNRFSLSFMYQMCGARLLLRCKGWDSFREAEMPLPAFIGRGQSIRPRMRQR
jgi:hypothetical protein